MNGLLMLVWTRSPSIPLFTKLTGVYWHPIVWLPNLFHKHEGFWCSNKRINQHTQKTKKRVTGLMGLHWFLSVDCCRKDVCGFNFYLRDNWGASPYIRVTSFETLASPSTSLTAQQKKKTTWREHLSRTKKCNVHMRNQLQIMSEDKWLSTSSIPR